MKTNSIHFARLAASVTLLIAPNLLAQTAPPQGFSNESEAGIVVTTGNSRSQSYNFKQGNAYVIDANSFKFNGQFLKTVSSGVESARYWSLGLRYERELFDMLSAFLAQSLESDVFAGFRQRFNTDLGAKYFIFKEQAWTWFAELGYRYTRDNLVGGGTNDKHQSRLYTETNNQWTETFSSKFWVEYIQNVELGKDYAINTEASIQAAMTKVLSLKTGYLVRFDNVPAKATFKKTDTVLTTALVAKF